MLKVGLTGSIAVGKTFVCDIFRVLGCNVLDADRTAREVVEPNTQGLRQIINAFGESVLQANGELDRIRLGAIVFGDKEKRGLLNEIVHPLVIKAQDRWIKECKESDPDGIAIIDASLMIESGAYKRFDKLIVVWCEPAIQLKRLMLRNELSEIEAKKRIGTQLSQEEKKSFADHLIDTSRGFVDTHRQTNEVFQKLKAHARKSDEATDAQ
jgi:dephospho-CoA kinase